MILKGIRRSLKLLRRIDPALLALDARGPCRPGCGKSDGERVESARGCGVAGRRGMIEESEADGRWVAPAGREGARREIVDDHGDEGRAGRAPESMLARAAGAPSFGDSPADFGPLGAGTAGGRAAGLVGEDGEADDLPARDNARDRARKEKAEPDRGTWAAGGVGGTAGTACERRGLDFAGEGGPLATEARRRMTVPDQPFGPSPSTAGGGP